MILLVEDSPSDMLLLCTLLGQGSCTDRTCQATRLAEALALIPRDRPDLILLDLGLPDSQGIDGLRAVQRAAPEIPIIVITGHGDDALGLAALQAGAEDFVQKDRLTAGALDRILRFSRERHRRFHELGKRVTAQEYQVCHDYLTGLPNRMLFTDRLQHAVAQARRERIRTAVIYLDLDGFKAVNDTMGHAAGDELLVQFASHAEELIRQSDTFARIGGDEFGIVLERVVNRAAAREMVETLHDRMQEPIPIGGRACCIRFSAGVALFPEDGTSAEALLQAADRAMYLEKVDGRHPATGRTRNGALQRPLQQRRS